MSRKRKMPSKKVILEYWHWYAVNFYVDFRGEPQSITRLEELGKQQPQKILFALEKIYNKEEVDIKSLYLLEFCFACGLYCLTERAHILAVCEDGEDNVDNIHLLCKRCHGESEMLSGEEYWNWFTSKNENLAFEYWRKEKEPRVKILMEKMILLKPANNWTREEIKDFIAENLYKFKVS